MARKRTFRVSLMLPDTVSDAMVIDYIADAVKSWKGQLKPESAMEDDSDWYDPLTDIDEDTVKVERG